MNERRIREQLELIQAAQELSGMQVRPSEDFTMALEAEGLLAGQEQPTHTFPPTTSAPEQPVTTFKAPDTVYQPNGYYPN